MLRVFIYISLIFSCLNSTAQVVRVQMEHLDERSGLPHSEIIRCITDRMGYMWMASNDGLIRYDGYEFRIFRSSAYDSTGFEGNRIWEIFEDHEGMLWLLTQNSLVRFNPVDFEIKRWNHLPVNFESPLNVDRRLLGITEDLKNRLWISSSYGLFMLDESRSHSEYYFTDKYPKLLYANHGRNLTSDELGNIWIGTYDGLFCFNPDNKNFEHFKPENGNPTIDRAISFWNGDIYFANEDLYKINIKNKKIELIQNSNFGSGWCTQILPDAENKNLLWLAFSNAGIGLFDRSNGSFTAYNSSVRKDELLPKYVSGISQNGNELLVSTSNGVFIFNNNNFFTKTFSSDYVNLDLAIYEVYPLNTSLQEETVILNTSNGLFAWNQGNSFTPYDFPTCNGRELIGINNWFRDSQGFDWISVGYEGLYKCKDGSCTIVLPDSIVEPGLRDYMWYIHEVAEDLNGNVWVAADSKLACITGEKSELYSPDPVLNSKGDTLMSKPSFSEILIDEDAIWLISEFSLQQHLTGVYRFDLKSKTFSQFLSGIDFPVISNIHQMTLSKDKVLWCATENGILKIDLNADSPCTLIESEHELASTLCEGITSDNEGKIWVSTRSGLLCMEPNGNSRIFGRNSGLFSNKIMSLLYSLPDGRKAFISKGGLVYFKPDEIPVQQLSGTPVISKILINNEELGNASPGLMEKVNNLRWNEGLISIYFSAFDFHEVKETEFLYKLEGVDKDWVFSGTRNFVNYTNLRGGDYLFMVKSRLRGGSWSEPAHYKFNVQTAWFRSAWFISALIFLAMLISFLLYRNRIKQLKQLHAIRDRIATDLHDDVGSALSSLVIYSDLLQKGQIDSRELMIVQKLKETASESMDNMRDIVWSIQSENDNFGLMMQRLSRLASEMFEPLNINVEFEVVPILEKSALGLEQRRNIYLLLKEALNNSRKYAKATKVLVKAEINDAGIVVSVTDNGIGFDLDSVAKGNGLKNMRKRASQIGASLLIKSSPGNGTSVVVQFKPSHH